MDLSQGIQAERFEQRSPSRMIRAEWSKRRYPSEGIRADGFEWSDPSGVIPSEESE